MDDVRTCPYCAEEIRAAATRCRYCRSRLVALDPEHWYRDHPERRLAGVACAVARALTLPVGAARLGFIVLAFVHLIGPFLYGALWLLIPFAPGGDAPLTRALACARDTLDRLLGERRRQAPRPSEPRARDDADGGAPRPGIVPLQRLSS
jgi:phage shock protein PspC (stress-responsive transcriptional regulator)